MKKLSLIAAIVFSTGCTTIHFENGQRSSNNTKTLADKWHHNVGLALYELSEPVNLDKECSSKDWVRVTTEQSIINSLAGGAVNGAGPIWYPKTVRIKCEK